MNSSKMALFKIRGQTTQFPSSFYPYVTTLLAVILNVASVSTAVMNNDNANSK